MPSEAPFSFKRGRRKRLDALSLLGNCPFVDEDNHSVSSKALFVSGESNKLRYDALSGHVQILRGHVQRLNAQLMSRLTNELNSFFERGYASIDHCSEFLTCLLVSYGFSVQDFDPSVLIDDFVQNGPFREHSFRATIDGRYLKNLRQTIAEISEQLFGGSSRRHHRTEFFDELVDSYRSEVAKKRKGNGLKTSVVFVTFLNVQSTSSQLLNDLLLILCSNLSNFPVCLVFPVELCNFEQIDECFSVRVKLRIRLHVVNIAQPADSLKKFLDALTDDENFHLKFNNECLKSLKEYWIRNSLCLESFAYALKALIVEHFLKHSMSFVCQGGDNWSNFLLKNGGYSNSSPRKRIKAADPDLKSTCQSLVEEAVQLGRITKSAKVFQDNQSSPESVFWKLSSGTVFPLIGNYDLIRKRLNKLDGNQLIEFFRRLEKETANDSDLKFLNDLAMESVKLLSNFKSSSPTNVESNQRQPMTSKFRCLTDLKATMNEQMRLSKEKGESFVQYKANVIEKFLNMAKNVLSSPENLCIGSQFFTEVSKNQSILDQILNSDSRRYLTQFLKHSLNNNKPVYSLGFALVLHEYLKLDREISAKKWFENTLKRKMNGRTVEKKWFEFYRILAEFEYVGLIKVRPGKKTIQRLVFHV